MNCDKETSANYDHIYQQQFNKPTGDFGANLPKIDKKLYKNINIYYIRYITIIEIDDYENIHSVNPFYLIIGKVDGFIEKKIGSKYLVLILQMKTRKY